MTKDFRYNIINNKNNHLDDSDYVYDSVATVAEDGSIYRYMIDRSDFDDFVAWACVAFESDLLKKASDYAELLKYDSGSQIDIVLIDRAEVLR